MMRLCTLSGFFRSTLLSPFYSTQQPFFFILVSFRRSRSISESSAARDCNKKLRQFNAADVVTFAKSTAHDQLASVVFCRCVYPSHHVCIDISGNARLQNSVRTVGIRYADQVSDCYL